MRVIHGKIIEALHGNKDRILSKDSIGCIRDRVIINGDCVVYGLFDTPIAVIDRSKQILTLGVYDGRWRTNTTKDRINAIACHFNVSGISQKNYVWTWTDGTPYTGEREFDITGKRGF